MNELQSAFRDYRAGEIETALRHCRRWLEIHPDDARALSLLGALYTEQAHHEAAVAAFQRLVSLDPQQALHRSNLGTALRAAGRYDEALAAYEQAAQRGATSSADFLLNVALLHLDRLETGKARTLLRQAARLAPGQASIRVMSAVAAYADADDETARRLLGGLELSGDVDRETLLRACSILTQTGAIATAERLLRKLRESDPDDRLATVRLAQLLERSNRVEEANACIADLPRDPPPQSLPRTRSGGELAEDWLAIEARLAERRGDHAGAELAYRQLLARCDVEHHEHHACYPLARSLDAQGRFEEAMTELARAHASQMQFLERSASHVLNSGGKAFSIADHPTDTRDVAAWSDPSAPDATASPIFVVGFPRSGTTLLEQMLDAHPALQSMDEQPFLQNAIDRLRHDGVAYPHALAAAMPQQLQSARDFYFARVEGVVPRASGRQLVDKNPLNLLRLPGMVRLFPNARIVLTIRHPCDVILSCYQQHFRAPEFASLCADLYRLAQAYVRAFDFWFNEAAKLAPVVHEIRYERLVSDFEFEARKLIAFLQLSWDEALLDPARRARERGFISTPSYAQVTEPVHQGSVDRWRRYEKYMASAIGILRPYLDRWGYSG